MDAFDEAIYPSLLLYQARQLYAQGHLKDLIVLKNDTHLHVLPGSEVRDALGTWIVEDPSVGTP